MVGWRSWTAVVVVGAVLGGGAVANADGLPTLGIDVGARGATTLDGASRFVTLPAGPNTVVARVATDGGTVAASTLVPGTVTIPAVAYDGSAAGVSADGTTLALIVPRTTFPRTRTGFVILDARTLRPTATVDLAGDFSFDAISPDGARLFLTHYTDPRDPLVYDVQAYDVRGKALGPPIVDLIEPEERMGGTPVSRATSPDGRWAYTLYDRFDGHPPFVHALDTTAAVARCIDLDMVASGLTPATTSLSVDAAGRRLTVEQRGIPTAEVDLAAFTAARPGGAPGPAPAPTSGAAWGLGVGAGLAALLAAVTAFLVRVRGRSSA